ncbi:MAG: hypothetical protein LBL93_01070 [Ruminococcus sp.]|jgi:hypothetical protein|nr:hypothetical protein [Ruminococcus sp.]
MALDFSVILTVGYKEVPGGNDISMERIHSFTFHKEFYIPYTSLRIKIPYHTSSFIGYPKRVRFYFGTKLIHDGLIDTAVHKKDKNFRGIEITSKGFTSELLRNQITPGLYTNVTFDSLMSDKIPFKNITWEIKGNESKNYVYVTRGSSFFDALVAFCTKNYARYPYVYGANKLMFTPNPNPPSILIKGNEICAFGQEYDFRRLVSKLNMSDIDGNYDAFSRTNTIADNIGLVRYNKFDLDRTFLNNPSDALKFREYFTNRKRSSQFVEYYGYKGEDLNDYITVSQTGMMLSKRINEITITAEPGIVRTKDYSYYDSFCNT